MGLPVFREGVVNIIRAHKLNACLTAHPHEQRIDPLLIRDSVVLQLQEKVSLSEDPLKIQGSRLCLIIKAPGQVSLHLARQAGRGRYDTLMVFFQDLLIHAGLVVIPVHKACRYDLHQVRIPGIVLCEKDQMIIPVIICPFTDLAVKPGSRSHIHLTSDDGIDPVRLCLFVEIDNAEHDAVIRDRGAVHSQFLDPGHIFLDLI